MKKTIFLFLFLQMFFSCIDKKKDILANDIELWRETEVWDFAKCVSTNDFSKAETLLNQNNIDVDFREPTFGETMLSWAVLNDNIDAVKFLVEHGANPNTHNLYNGTSPISYASCSFNSIHLLECLLEHGGNPNDYVSKDEILTYGRSNKTPLINAAFNSLEKTKMLINAGADVNFSVEPGYTPICQAAIGTTMDVLEYFLYNCKIDYRKTYLVTLDTQDTLFLKDIIKTNKVAFQKDSIKAKQIIDYINKNFQWSWGRFR